MFGPTPGASASRAAGRRAGERHAHVAQHSAQLVADHVRQGADQHQPGGVAGGEGGDQRREAGVLAFGEGGLDAGAGIVQHPDVRGEMRAQALGGARQIELDDLGGAGADEEELPDAGPALQHAGDLALEFLIGVGEAGEVALLEDRGPEARLAEDHHARRRLQQVGAGARADDEEEGVLHAPVQPDDAGQAAEDFALAALPENRGFLAGTDPGRRVHAGDPAASSRAARSFSRNCPAFTA